MSFIAFDCEVYIDIYIYRGGTVSVRPRSSRLETGVFLAKSEPTQRGRFGEPHLSPLGFMTPNYDYICSAIQSLTNLFDVTNILLYCSYQVAFSCIFTCIF
jgi:hypothetical protein